MNVRKILIPVVAGLFISPAMMAADLDGETTGRTFSNEYLGTADATDIVAGDVLAVLLEAEYAVSDIITLTFSGMPNSLEATYDFPLPGPPAKKIALKIPGSLAPSVSISSSVKGFVKNSVSLFIVSYIVSHI